MNDAGSLIVFNYIYYYYNSPFVLSFLESLFHFNVILPPLWRSGSAIFLSGGYAGFSRGEKDEVIV